MNKFDNLIAMTKTWTEKDRINWNDYFLCLAILTSIRSPCNRLHVGCVLVKNNRVVSVGYNGFLAGEKHESIIRTTSDGREHEMATIHAEQNAICYGGNAGISLKKTIAYITHYPCLECAKLLTSCGVTHVYYHDDYHNDPLVSVICNKLKIVKI
jgi:dCMP deaminase